MSFLNTAWYVGSVEWSNVAAWTASHAYSAGALVRQNATPTVGNERVFVCIVGGASGASEPAWVVTKGAKTTDGSVTWMECSGMAGLNDNTNGKTDTPPWTNGSSTALGQIITQKTSPANYFICTTSSGNTGASEPSWVTTSVGSTTSDGSNVWMNLGAITGATKWGAPHARLANALATNWGAAGNVFYVSADHAETQSTAITLTFPGTSAAPNSVFCVSSSGSTPPVSANLATTATITSSVASGVLQVSGYAYIYGIGVLATGSSTYIVLGGAASAEFRFDSCNFAVGAGTSFIVIGLGANNFACDVEWLNTPVSFSATSNYIAISVGNLKWRDTPSAIGGSAVPTTLFSVNNSRAGTLVLDGVDLSAAGSGKTLFGANAASPVYQMTNCKLGAGVTVAATPTTRGGAKTFVAISDSANTTYRQEVYAYEGTLTTDTVDIRSGGATDGTTPIAWKVVTTANASEAFPFETFEIAKWCGSTGSPVTASIAIMSNATLTNQQVWLEVEYLGNASYPVTSLATGRAADLLPTTSGSSWPIDSTSTWTATGVSGPVQQTLSVTFTPQQVGYVRIKVKVAAPSQTLRIDPLIQGF